jgi:hypothetical protein
MTLIWNPDHRLDGNFFKFSLFLTIMIILNQVTGKIHNLAYKSSDEQIYYNSDNSAFSWRGNLHMTCSNVETNLKPVWTEMYPYNYVETLSLQNFTFMPVVPEGEYFSSLTTILVRSKMKTERTTSILPPKLYVTSEYGEVINMLQTQDFSITNFYRLVSSHSDFKGKESFFSSRGTTFSIDLDVGLFPGSFDDKFFVECIEVFITYETANIIRDKPTDTEDTNTYLTTSTGDNEDTRTRIPTTESGSVTNSEPGTNGKGSEISETAPPLTDIEGRSVKVEFNLRNIIIIVCSFFVFVVISAVCVFSVIASIITMYEKRFNATLIDENNCELVEDYWNPNVLVLHNLLKNKTIVYYTKFKNFNEIKNYATEIETFSMFSSSTIVEGQKVYSRTRDMGYTVEGIWFPITCNYPIKKMLHLLTNMHKSGFIHGRISRECFWYLSKGFDPSKNRIDIAEVRIFDMEALNGSSFGRPFYADETLFEKEFTGNVVKYSKKASSQRTLDFASDVWQFVNSFKEELGIKDINNVNFEKGFEGLLKLVEEGVKQ